MTQSKQKQKKNATQKNEGRRRIRRIAFALKYIYGYLNII